MSDLSKFHSDHLTAGRRGDVMLVTLRTPSIYEEEVIEQIGRELNSLITDHECSRLVVDISAVCLITSSLIGKFVHLHRRLKTQNGCLVLCGAQGHLETIFRASNLVKYFHIRASATEAIQFAQDYSAAADATSGKPSATSSEQA